MSSDPKELIAVTDTDIRHVAVIWSTEHEHPQLLLGGCSEYEAVGLLRAALLRLEADTADTIRRDDEDEDEDEDDGGGGGDGGVPRVPHPSLGGNAATC